jgi:hypothetical protein
MGTQQYSATETSASGQAKVTEDPRRNWVRISADICGCMKGVGDGMPLTFDERASITPSSRLNLGCN